MRGFVAASVIVIAGITGYVLWQVKKIQDFTTKLVSKRIVFADLNRIIIELMLEIGNDSDVNITVNSYDLDLTVNGNFLSKVQQKITQVISSKGKSYFTVLLDFNPKTVAKQAINFDFIASLLKNKSNIVVGLNGYVSILGVKNLPVSISKPLSEI